jgi:hypothetical protein
MVGTHGVRIKYGSGYGTERNGYGVKTRNGTDMGLKCGTERIWVKTRNGTERIWVKMRNGTERIWG